MTIHIQNASSIKSIPTINKMKSWATQALKAKNKDAEVTIRIVDEDEGRELNKTWRNKDYATNVLSFPVGEKIEQAPEFLGDIVICVQVVEREAKEQGKDIEAHWAHLIVHGILHIQGYDHEIESEADIMEAKEILILKKIGYANPYKAELQE